MAITRTEANRIVEAAVVKAREFDIRICVAVCDAGGRLLAFSRMDGANWGAGYGSQGKAVASACFGKPGRVLEERADTPLVRDIAAWEGGHMAIGQGAVPIIRKGVVEGACGVGGATRQEDDVCAQAGADALQHN